MMPVDYLYLNGLRYKREVLMVKYFIRFFVAILEAWLPQFLSFGVGFLQLLKPEPYTSNADLIKAFIR